MIAIDLLSNPPSGFCDEKRPLPNLVGDYIARRVNEALEVVE